MVGSRVDLTHWGKPISLFHLARQKTWRKRTRTPLKLPRKTLGAIIIPVRRTPRVRRHGTVESLNVCGELHHCLLFSDTGE